MTAPGDHEARLARARAALATYGANPAAWPAADRALASLVADDPARAEEARLDALLALAGAGAGGAEPNELSVRRALRRRPDGLGHAFSWGAAAALAACAALGVVIGAGAPGAPGLAPESPAVEMAAHPDDLFMAALAGDAAALVDPALQGPAAYDASEGL